MSFIPVLLAAAIALAPELPGEQNVGQTEEEAVAATVNALFDAMRAGDGEAVAELFAPGAIMMTVVDRDGRTVVTRSDPADFARAVGTPRVEVWDERISGLEIRIDGSLATAWMNYAFHLDDRFSHCGVNAMSLVRLDEMWRILQITDTRRPVDCN